MQEKELSGRIVEYITEFQEELNKYNFRREERRAALVTSGTRKHKLPFLSITPNIIQLQRLLPRRLLIENSDFPQRRT